MTIEGDLSKAAQQVGSGEVSLIARYEQLLSGKDDMLQAQMRELTECRRQLELAQEGVTHWRKMAAQHEVEANEFHAKWVNQDPVP